MSHKILFISPFVPYDKVGHAGGQIHNYYIKKFQKDNNFEIKLFTFAEEEEVSKIDLKKYNICAEIVVKKNNIIHNIYRKLLNSPRKINIFVKSAGMIDNYMKIRLLKGLKRLKSEGYIPKVIVLEWTQSIALLDSVKKIYPDTKIISLEHDVSFLGYERLYKMESNLIKRYIRKVKYYNLLKFEIDKLQKSDRILTLNYKDKNLLINHQMDANKIDTISPYFNRLIFSDKRSPNKKILFFGAMSRKENYESCIWFIENVFNKLLEIDNEYIFYIVGGNPPQKLLNFKSRNVIVTGFVDSIDEYFMNCMCMVAPLVFGAGIKIKILEGMSSGIPILTNDIGIEGIPAIHNKDYFHCVSPNDYLETILDLTNEKFNIKEISLRSAKMLKNEFNLEQSYNKYRTIINNLIDKII